MEHKADVLVIGGGLSGLTAARVLKQAGKAVKLLEASDDIGGRIRTDYVDGYQFDRGFQVLLTAYPEARAILDYAALDLCYFDPGAVILKEGGITTISDPFRKPGQLWNTLISSAGTLADKVRMLKLRQDLKKHSIEQIFSDKQASSTLNYLQAYGFSPAIIRNFFRPFFAGVFLESALATPSIMFKYLFKMFSEGSAAVPAGGMGMISKQLAQNITNDIILKEKAVMIEGGMVRTQNGNCYSGEKILIATDLKDQPYPLTPENAVSRSVYNVYFSADAPPVNSPMVMVDAFEGHMINNIAVMNNISSHYAPAGKYLISVSIVTDTVKVDPAIVSTTVKEELSYWFKDADKWKYLRAYDIPYALPVKDNYLDNAVPWRYKLADGLFCCGDHLLNGSINAAIRSGRSAAEAILSM